MKKILFLFMMFMGLISSLSAIVICDYGRDALKISHQGIECNTDTSTVVGSVSTQAIGVLHKDTLMYSWIETQENKIKTLISSEWPPTLNPINKAMVRQGSGC